MSNIEFSISNFEVNDTECYTEWFKSFVFLTELTKKALGTRIGAPRP